MHAIVSVTTKTTSQLIAWYDRCHTYLEVPCLYFRPGVYFLVNSRLLNEANVYLGEVKHIQYIKNFDNNITTCVIDKITYPLIFVLFL